MRRTLFVTAGVLCCAAVAAGLAWFQPWKLWVDERVDEALPAVAIQVPHPDRTPAARDPRPSGARSPAPRSPASRSVTPPSTSHRPVDRLISQGSLISHEHSTSGTVSVVRQVDGTRVLTLANLRTSNGPDLHVWLTDAPVLPSSAGWHLFDDGRHVSVGTLKGNLGNQLYDIPAGTNLRQLTSVTIWCDRFDVSFGAAELRPVG